MINFDDFLLFEEDQGSPGSSKQNNDRASNLNFPSADLDHGFWNEVPNRSPEGLIATQDLVYANQSPSFGHPEAITDQNQGGFSSSFTGPFPDGRNSVTPSPPL